MKLTRTLLTIAFTSAIAVTAAAHADDEDKSQEGKAAKYRHNSFSMVSHHFGPMGDMVKGKADYDKDAFANNAEALAAIGTLIPNGFAVEGVAEGSRAKKEIWEDKDKFNAILKKFADDTAALAAESKSGDMDLIKPAFLKVADSCKQCHKSYRAKKD